MSKCSNKGTLRILAVWLAFMLVLGMTPVSAVAAVEGGDPAPFDLQEEGSQAGEGSVSIEKIEDKEARIVVAGDGEGSVDWGSEPLVVTLRATPAEVDFTVDVYPRSLMKAELTGLNGNVLILTPQDVVGRVTVTVRADDADSGDYDETEFNVDIKRYEDTGKYEWGDLQIPGSGFTSGYVFHPKYPDRLYARTDVGGLYRYNFEEERWDGITFWATPDNDSGNSWYSNGVMGAFAIAVDPDVEDSLYILYGSSGKLARSMDCGDTWEIVNSGSGVNAGSNDAARGLGERLVVMPGTGGQTIWIGGGTSGGLRKSTNGGRTFTGVNLTHGTGRNPTTNETVISFINYDPLHTDFMIVATGGVNGNPGNSARLRGKSVFYSEDAGATWAELPYQPYNPIPESQWAGLPTGNPAFGYVGQRSAFSPHTVDQDTGEHYFFITYTDPRVTWSGATDIGMEGGKGRDGCVFRYSVDKDGKLMADKGHNITPRRVEGVYIRDDANPVATNETYRQSGSPFIGISADPNLPGALITTTHNTDDTPRNPLEYQRPYDIMYRSLDYGETWFPILGGYDTFGDVGVDGIFARAPHASPMAHPSKNNDSDKAYNPYKTGATETWLEPWAGFFHWSTSPLINPFDSDMLVMNSGMGSYMTFNLTELDELGKLYAEPHMESPYANASDIEDPRGELKGFFKTKGTGATKQLIDYIPENNLESRYERFRIGSGAENLERGVSVHWEATTGLEMTVHKGSSLYSPPSGENIALGNLGDHGGVGFKNLEEPVSVTFAHKSEVLKGSSAGRTVTSSWISGNNTDYSDFNPDIIVSALKGDWHHNTTSGLAISFDGGHNWSQLPDGFLGTEENPGAIPRKSYTRPEYQTYGAGNGMPTAALQNRVDNTLKSAADVDPGFVAMSADSETIIWEMGNLSTANIVATNDYGQNWFQPVFYSSSTGDTVLGSTNVKIFSDRVNPDVFYAFTEASLTMYVSTDKGMSFRPVTISGGGIAASNLTHGANNGWENRLDIRPESGKEGVIWIGGASSTAGNATNRGIWKLTFNKGETPAENTMTAENIVAATGTMLTFRMGLGIGAGADNDNKAIYTYARTNPQNGVQQSGWGVYRSVDGGSTWRKITPSTDNPNAMDNRNHNYADVRATVGDSRTFGRVYFSTGNSQGGIRWGEMVTEFLKAPDTEKAALDRVIEEAEKFIDTAVIGNGEGECPQDVYDNLKALVSVAHDIILNEDATQGEIDKMLEELQNALDAAKEPFIEVTSVKVDGAAIQQVRMRNTKQFTATVNPANATDQSVTWESSNEKIFTVKDGLVTGLSTGSAKLIVTCGGKTSFIMVQVTA